MPEQNTTKFLIVDHLSLKDIIRIFSKIEVDPVTGCWNWTGSLDGSDPGGGYGNYYLSGRKEKVHRLIYAWLVEPLPRGNRHDIPCLDHIKCDNGRCCNPAHLSLGPQRSNLLRGSGVSAMNARKTHCKHGHLFTPEMFKMRRTSYGWRIWRRCKACHTLHNNRARAAKKNTLQLGNSKRT